ncbi:protein RCC2-like isoform X7 [Trifolium pratense]|uniref:protein RCC2-like isoform X3 n=1 Tax=Trifolium pratense TaxID=57577 RepID=UPI001E696BD9|nr:protein RCC2-like isoform X3 [Trifolium pratense]XP_045788846.1 protein RCC2-like isoform X3 [Trifolium pratense]XP_045793930.1 protein RCC2-like isoform X7 [Trifolium pratense]XP_045793931.1 protein RCC2-like isoform X7 [Trifolium pratense]XP_045793932.1 protein RCC2-like isoform X7 [Trifolium pratense]XP_045793933.1 protein RCC2-like isoform X7 [Trifolium pratense]XP_045793934.1 protein RCC2-like isoform X7 [Trifolium pratense]XP_045793935.1 protein RCC2-like isoform X7 [Trifolium prate
MAVAFYLCAKKHKKGQLGHGDTIQRDRPTVVSELSKYKIVQAGAGRSHTVVVTDDGNSLAFGWNKHGQLGSGSAKTGWLLQRFTTLCCFRKRQGSQNYGLIVASNENEVGKLLLTIIEKM